MKDSSNKEATLRGLPILLQENESHGDQSIVGFVHDKSRTDSMEQTLNHIFNVGPGHPAAFIASNEDCSEQIDLSLQLLLQELPGYDGSGRVGIMIMNDGPGNEVVDVDRQSRSGDLKFLRGGSVLESQAAFSSVRCNTCVSKGKWMYEVTLETGGIQQLGWATRSCSFTREEGVGDSTDSYAYDGRRVRKWSVSWHPYGQPWVSGDVIGCCIDLDKGEISFFRNGVSLGVAFTEVGRSDPQFPYYPAISLSQGERCDLNLGGRPFRYPVENFQPLQAPPLTNEDTRIPLLTKADFLLNCLQRLLQLDSKEVVLAMAPEDMLRRLKPLGEFALVVGKKICKLFGDLLAFSCQNKRTLEYVTWGALVPFLMELYRSQPPHDVLSVNSALNWILSFLDSDSVCSCIEVIMEALAYGCRTSSIVLADSPYTASYPYLALAIYLLRRQDVLMCWYNCESFEVCLEGLLSKKGPNKYDLEKLMPTVWWPGSREDLCTENNMRQTSQALSNTFTKVEELQLELCYYLLESVPTSNIGSEPSKRSVQLKHPSGSIFMSFLRHLVGKNKGAVKNMPPPGLSDNSVLMTAYTVLLHFLSEGIPGSSKFAIKEQDGDVGFLHRGGRQSFDVRLFLDADSYASDFARLGGTFSHLLKAHILAPNDREAVVWEEGCMEDGDRKVTHLGKQKPCCCPGISGSPITCSMGFVRVLNKGFNIHVNSVSENSGATRLDHGRRSGPEVEDEKPCSSGRVEPFYGSLTSLLPKEGIDKAHAPDFIQEEELLDIMVLLYHIGVAPNFKQASYYLQHQVQYISQLDETDRQIRAEKTSSDHVKRLKDARAIYREDLIESVRQSTWFKVSLFSKWKQRGMFATCMWIVQLLLMMSNRDALFNFVPEYYVETLVTFLVTHFNDIRIANSDIRDAILQSISVLVQYKEHVVAFESNMAAIEVMPAALLAAFDNRFWIPVTNILLRLCKGTGFGSSKSSAHGESCSPTFQGLLRDRCLQDEKLFSSFLNRLFNTLNWTITEFSVAMKELQEQREQRQVPDLQQRKCLIMFELSCNLERVLEFFTRELPQAFLCGPEMNLVRLCELLMFVLSHTTTADPTFFETTLRHQGQSFEKMNRAMILAPLVGIILNLSAAKKSIQHVRNDAVQSILNVDVSSIATRNFEYLVDFNWSIAFKGDPSLARLPDLKEFLRLLKAEALAAKQRELEEDSFSAMLEYDSGNGPGDEKEDICSICYACEINTVFYPCNHKSCWRCISRHLLNNQRCFFCNTIVQDLRSMSIIPASAHSQYEDSEAPNGAVGESGLLVKIDPP